MLVYVEFDIRVRYRVDWLSVERAVSNGPHVRSTGQAFFDTASESIAK
jgi:hypothetical protein